jgi:hypothetical protein
MGRILPILFYNVLFCILPIDKQFKFRQIYRSFLIAALTLITIIQVYQFVTILIPQFRLTFLIALSFYFTHIFSAINSVVFIYHLLFNLTLLRQIVIEILNLDSFLQCRHIWHTFVKDLILHSLYVLLPWILKFYGILYFAPNALLLFGFLNSNVPFCLLNLIEDVGTATVLRFILILKQRFQFVLVSLEEINENMTKFFIIFDDKLCFQITKLRVGHLKLDCLLRRLNRIFNNIILMSVLKDFVYLVCNSFVFLTLLLDGSCTRIFALMNFLGVLMPIGTLLVTVLCCDFTTSTVSIKI